MKSLLGDLQFADGIATVGQGRILLGGDLSALMAKAKIAREPMADDGLKFIRRKLPGEVVYFIANRIRDLDQRKVGWKKFKDINLVDHQYKKFDVSQWPVEPSGLLGPVTLIPMTLTSNTDMKIK